MPLSRRKFLGTALTAGASGLIVNAATPSATAAPPDFLVLENDRLTVAIDRETGCIARLESKDQAWKMQGAGMRLHVPAPEHRFHYLDRDASRASRELIQTRRTRQLPGTALKATEWASSILKSKSLSGLMERPFISAMKFATAAKR